MPKYPAFDRENVIQSAMACFWRKGFLGANIRELGLATGLTTGSLYNSFGSKENLFAECLGHYIETVVSRRVEVFLQGDNPRDGIRKFISSINERDNVAVKSGCFLANTYAELHRLPTSAVALVQRGQDAIDTALKVAVISAQAKQQIDSALDATVLVEQLSLLATAASIRGRKSHSRLQQSLREKAIEATLGPVPAPSCR